MHRSIPAALAALALFLLAGGSANADDAGVDQNGDTVDLHVNEYSEQPGQPGDPGGAPFLQCSSTVYIHDDGAMGGVRWDPVAQQVLVAYAPSVRYFSSTGRWFVERCAWSDDPDHIVSHRTYPEGEPVDPIQLMRQATARLDPPDPSISTAPPHSRDLLVQTPTWLWIGHSYWQPYTATASTGRVSATATATPVQITWDMGNGANIVCAGPGMPWRAGVSGTDSECAYTYRHSSAGQPNDSFDLVATVTFDVVWSSVNAGGMGGPLARLTRSATVPVRVGEVQALVTAD